MKFRLGVPKSRPLADFLPTITIAAKYFATEMTNFNVKQQELQGEPAITQEHIKSNTAARKSLLDRNIKPEDLPPEEDIKKLERRVKAADKKSIKSAGALKKGKKK